jgi:pilus assembly protein TadC
MSGSVLAAALISLALAAAAGLAFSRTAYGRSRLLRQCGGAAGNGIADKDDDSQHRAAQSPGLRDIAMMLELIAAMLHAGAGIGRALELVADAATPQYGRALRPVVGAMAIGADWETAWRSSDVRSPEILALRDALGFAALTGAPSSSILYAQAARMRRERFRAAEKRAASLGVKLVVPLGLCSLPAFICLGVVPVLLALVPSGS